MSVNISVPRDNNQIPLPIVAASVQTGTQTNALVATAKKLITASTPCKRVVISAYATNANTIAIGDSSAKAEPLSGGSKNGQGEQVIAGGSTIIDIQDASLLYLAVATANDGVSYSIYA